MAVWSKIPAIEGCAASINTTGRFRMSQERMRRVQRRLPCGRSAMIESLEERQLLTLTIDVRTPSGGKSIQVTSVGQVVLRQVSV